MKSPKQSQVLCCLAITSDSLLFKSLTCTGAGRCSSNAELAAIAGVDAEKYGLEMLEAGADLSDKTIAQLITLMPRKFFLGMAKAEIAQVNAVDPNEVLTS